MQSIRGQYAEHGVPGFYEKGEYENPHALVVQKFVHTRCAGFKRVLDLACGNGEVTRALSPSCDIVGCDPFLDESYIKNTGRKCWKLSFEDIAQSGFPEDNFDLIVCSFALHLAPVSILPNLLYQLARISANLVIIGPSKFPVLDHWQWKLEEHTIKDRIHFRLFARS